MPNFGQSTVGVVGTYPNGGFPSQAFYGVMGSPVATSTNMSSANSSSNGASLNFFASNGGGSTLTVVATVLILALGSYALWHYSY